MNFKHVFLICIFLIVSCKDVASDLPQIEFKNVKFGQFDETLICHYTLNIKGAAEKKLLLLLKVSLVDMETYQSKEMSRVMAELETHMAEYEQIGSLNFQITDVGNWDISNPKIIYDAILLNKDGEIVGQKHESLAVDKALLKSDP